MDAVLVGALAAAGTVTGMLYWLVLVRPDALLSLLSDAPDVGWMEMHTGTLRALRWVGGAVVFVVAFITGLAVAFLAGTSA